MKIAKLRLARDGSSLKAGIPVFLMGLILGMILTVSARAQDALSGPVSDRLSEPIYSESVQTGPSTSLLPGGTNLTSPSVRSGISDPLGFLIETNSMSPYLIGGGTVSSYADAELPNYLLNDSTAASHVSEYRNNRLLMGGAGVASTLTGTAATAGSTGMQRAGTSAMSAGTAAFSRIGSAAPFAAGSSLLAQQSSPAAGSFTNPNVLASEMSSAAGVAAMQADPAAATALLSGMQSGLPISADTMGYSPAGISVVMPVSTMMVGMQPVPSAQSTAFGPAPGEPFVNMTVAFPATSGFPDSTMGTAGLPYAQLDAGYTSPLLAPETSVNGPFQSISAEDSVQLHPTLFGDYGAIVGEGGSRSMQSFSQLARKARMHAMIYSPGAPQPTTFDMRSLKRDYQRQHSGGQVHRKSTLTAPSIKP